MKIAITTTAILRPYILDKTLKSFENFFKGHNCTIILNIDNVGYENKEWDVFQVANRYFDKIVPNYCKTPHFGAAFKWCWEQVGSEYDYVFNLEDDWLLNDKDLNIKSLITIMNKNKNLASLRLSYKPASGLTQKNWDRFFPYNICGYYQCLNRDRKNAGFCGHPSLITGSFVRKVTPMLYWNANPEKQFHYKEDIVNEVLKYDWGVYVTSFDMKEPLISDIGRDWISNTNFEKAGSKAFFTHYRKKG